MKPSLVTLAGPIFGEVFALTEPPLQHCTVVEALPAEHAILGSENEGANFTSVVARARCGDAAMQITLLGRTYFLALSARPMPQTLIDQVRRNRTNKVGASAFRSRRCTASAQWRRRGCVHGCARELLASEAAS